MWSIGPSRADRGRWLQRRTAPRCGNARAKSKSDGILSSKSVDPAHVLQANVNNSVSQLESAVCELMHVHT